MGWIFLAVIILILMPRVKEFEAQILKRAPKRSDPQDFADKADVFLKFLKDMK